ncbi:hypothetical protein VZT92_011672 [Zoarces viviparus]|uniref:Uncharacterized protein n=1 Tax=Zoarces viviparus TaxID=48416 RepID=A0AAW1F5Z2_ZOAVI
MMLTGFLFLLCLTDGVYSERHCSYQDVLNHLNLTQNNELYSMTRPVKNYKRPTLVSLEVVLYAILDVVEKDQKFIPYVWTVMRWHNEYISWDPNDFCGIDNISLPAEILWKPDLTIEEMTEKDKAPPSPYLTINNKGVVEVHNDQVLVSTCRMHIYKFPFDIQRCNLSFKSVVHTARDIRLQPSDNSSEATEWSRELMRTQYEWLFINMTVTANNASDMVGHDMIIYTITMKRRSILYIVNFLTPVLFFLCLDLASFLISDSGGEKLSFKVTVLLAVTVLQLILNEILPATSNRIPLIALYCIGIFALMLLSLLETILVMHLVEKDSQAAKDIEADEGRSRSEGGNKRGETNFQNSHGEVHEWTRCACIYDGSTAETPSELLPVAKEGNSSKLIEEYHALEKLSDELREMEKTLSMLLNNRKEEEKPGYWTRVAKKNEKDQQFVSYIWIYLRWYDRISWVRGTCDISKIYPPSSVLWTPDITIEEMIDKNKVPDSPYLLLDWDGEVFLKTNMVVVSSCPMEVYKFPFDVQSCKLTFQSIVHSDRDLDLINYDDISWNIEWTLSRMPQSEWLFTNMNISKGTSSNFGRDQSSLVYTITMKRRSALYVANFLLPILFFLCLDLTSFLISDTGGEKLSFKVTVLLAVTVMQLILNEILPSSSDRIPLISIYCIGIFGLMMLSLLETIVVMRLLEKDSASQANKADEDQSLSEDCGDCGEVAKANCGTELKNRTPSVCNVTVDETPSEQLSKEDNSSQPTEELNALEKISGELKEIEKTLTQVLHCTKEEGKPGYWTRVAKKVNIVFFFFYVTAASVLLSVLFILWNE